MNLPSTGRSANGGFTHKQVSRATRERSELKRLDYQALIGDLYPAEALVFLDESHCDKRTTQCKFGWAPAGDRARRSDFFIRGYQVCCLCPTCF
ncbi:hypothetical protein C8F01DRAFT_759246 [Mycena amicta]|nr:hypothetical protein C8F01DRAFT_759246 [Mycena amicta]